MAHSHILNLALYTGLLLHFPSKAFINKEITRYTIQAAIATMATYTIGHNLYAWFGPTPSVPEITTDDQEMCENIKKTLAQRMPIAPELINFLENKNLALTLDAYNSQLRMNEFGENLSPAAQAVLNKAINQAINLLNTQPQADS